MVGLLGAHQHISFRGTLLYERAGSRQFIDVDWSAGSGEARLRRLNRVADHSGEVGVRVVVLFKCVVLGEGHNA